LAEHKELGTIFNRCFLICGLNVSILYKYNWTVVNEEYTGYGLTEAELAQIKLDVEHP